MSHVLTKPPFPLSKGYVMIKVGKGSIWLEGPITINTNLLPAIKSASLSTARLIY
jgi:hypothetical protein